MSADATTVTTAATGESESATVLAASGTASTSASTLNGIDISGWNPDIDLSKVSADFVIIKATEGTSYTSDTYQTQASAALTAGDLIGFYHYYSATSGTATDQASYFTSAVSSYIGSAALVLDWEADAVFLGTSYAKTWLDTVYGLTGVSPLIYMSKSVSQEYDWTSVAASYKLWVAQYASDDVTTGYQDDPWHTTTPCGAWCNDYTIFQYSSTTRLSGYAKNLDVNKYYGTTSDWALLASSTRPSPIVENADATGTLEAPEYEADLSISGLPSSTPNVWFAVWSAINNQDDIIWYAAAKNESGAWTTIVMPTDHGDTGVYEVHCYATLASKLTFVGNTSFTVAELAKYGWVKDADGIEHYTRGVQDKGWVVTAESPSGTTDGLQRYWIGADGYLVKGRLVTDDESDRWAYADSDGIIARGKYTDVSSGYVYLADNDGRLADPGWHVTDDYGSGLQRYWVDVTAHACVPGYSAEGWEHYTLPAGYVLRGSATIGGTYYLADNDGLLANGWIVTSGIGSYGLQRYWFEKGTYVRNRLIDAATAGWCAYATASGYVVRGKYTDVTSGNVYLADNDGRLESAGWHVTDGYGDGLQRYWVDANARACVPGYSVDGWAHYTLPAGYVLRGPATIGGTYYLADNDGLLSVV
jgi:GH25 family lysozyme M1 (1,4-beta-N-acetylmuramidase)